MGKIQGVHSMEYIAVIFDLDGVVLDTEPVSRDGWRYALKKMGLELKDRVFFKLVGLTAKGMEKVFRQEYGNGFSYEQAEWFRHEYVKEHVKKNGIKIKPGVFELLDFLDEQKIKRAIATSTSREFTERKMGLTELKDRFETIVCGDEIENGKPEPDIFLKAAEKLAVTPERCVVIEDSANGIRAAHAAGMNVIMVPDLKGPTEEILKLVYKVYPSLYEVKTLLEGF